MGIDIVEHAVHASRVFGSGCLGRSFTCHAAHYKDHFPALLARFVELQLCRLRDQSSDRVGSACRLLSILMGGLSTFAIPSKPEEVVNHRCVRFHSSDEMVRPWKFSQRIGKIKMDPPGGLTGDSSHLVRDAVLNDYGRLVCLTRRLAVSVD